MAKPPVEHRSRASKQVRSGFEKMQMNHRRTREEIKRIRAEAAERTATGKPVHIEGAHRR